MENIYKRGRENLFALLTTIFTVAFSTVFAQDPVQYGTPFTKVPDTRDITMYQVNIRAFSPESNLAGVTARLGKIRDLGSNVVYLMPILPVGTDARSKVASSTSPYSIKDFTSVGAEYGTLADVRKLVDEAHSRGMAVILDWVVNQTSWDHPWITQHPDWYVRDANGVIQQLGSYTDVAALDVNNADMRAAMINAMRYWIFAANIDGFRCDFANNPPLDFWKQTITNLRSINSHKLIMMAEGDRLENFNAGFDLNFGFKFYYEALKAIHEGAPVTNIQTATDKEYTYADNMQQVARYTGNHDTNGSEGTPLEVFGGTAGVMANFVVSAYMKGVPFIYGGQEVAFAKRIPFPWDGVNIDWDQNASVTEEFKNVIGFRNSSMAIRRGVMANYSDLNVCAFTKIADTEKVLVFSNLRSTASEYIMPAALAGTYKDAYTGASVTLTAGAPLSLKGFEYRALTTMNIPAFTRISVSPLNASIVVGTTKQLTATITPLAAKNQAVTWSSSNTNIATVNKSGLVTGITPGSVTITAAINGNKIATSAITVMKPYSYTVNFFRPTNWGTGINIYWYNAEPAGSLPSPSWPGVSMTDNGDGWYSYTFNNVSSATVIFNDGTHQTADVARNKTGWYINGAWYDTKPEVSTNTFTVSFFKPSNWGTGINIYWYGADPAGSLPDIAWPGVSMSSEGDGWYSYTFNNVSSTNLIFNDGSLQSADLTRSKTGWYVNGAWYDTKPEVSVGSAYYLIKNRWQDNAYLYDDEKGLVRYGTSPTTANYQWERVEAGDGFFLLKNRATGNLMHVEDQTGSVQSTDINATWWSAMWSLPATDDGWNHIQNRWQTTQIVNIEGLAGYAQYSGAELGWWSAMWQFVKAEEALNSQEAMLAVKAADAEKGTFSLLEVFPNPARDKVFNIYIPRLHKDELATLSILDVNGRTVMKTEVHQSAKIKHNLKPGLYFVRISASEMNAIKKLIVE